MKKNYAMPGDELTDEKRQNAKEFGESREAEIREKLEAQQDNKAIEVDIMNVTFEPFEDRVLVFPDPIEEKTAGGIFKPEAVVAKTKPLIGTVVKVGPGKITDLNRTNYILMQLLQAASYSMAQETFAKIRKDWTLDQCQSGMRIYYGNYAGTEIELNGLKYLIMRFADIFGKV